MSDRDVPDVACVAVPTGGGAAATALPVSGPVVLIGPETAWAPFAGASAASRLT